MLEENRDIEALNSRLVRKINMVQANHAKFVAGLAKIPESDDPDGPKTSLE